VEPGTNISALPPEYKEFLGQTKEEVSTTEMYKDPPIQAPFPFPSLCKASPTNFYEYVLCWTMLGLYVVLIITLIIYQLRSIIW
jgi:hypothetical protein